MNDKNRTYAEIREMAVAAIPSDIAEFGRRHKIPELTSGVWVAAYMVGFTDALLIERGTLE